jgi:adenylylsulfate kinase
MTKARMPFVLWLTGLSGSGKSTLADKIADSLSVKGYDFERLDGDTLRGVFPSTGFSRAERDEHIQRVGFMSGLLEKHGVIVIASFISPYRQARDFVRKRCRNFIEVYVKASLATCEARDVKGLYKKARAGQIREFTGIDDPYEEPVNPELVIETDRESIEESSRRIREFIQKFL